MSGHPNAGYQMIQTANTEPWCPLTYISGGVQDSPWKCMASPSFGCRVSPSCLCSVVEDALSVVTVLPRGTDRYTAGSAKEPDPLKPEFQVPFLLGSSALLVPHRVSWPLYFPQARVHIPVSSLASFHFSSLFPSFLFDPKERRPLSLRAHVYSSALHEYSSHNTHTSQSLSTSLQLPWPIISKQGMCTAQGWTKQSTGYREIISELLFTITFVLSSFHFHVRLCFTMQYRNTVAHTDHLWLCVSEDQDVPYSLP